MVGASEDLENLDAIHQNRIARRRPPGKGRAAYIGEPVGLFTSGRG
jgi:hypothetical protein